MRSQQLRNWYAVSLVIIDGLMVALAFTCAYALRAAVPWPDQLVPEATFSTFSGLMILEILLVLLVLFLNRQYYIPRAISRVDQFYAVSRSVFLGTMLAVAASVFIFSGDFDFPRAMMLYTLVFAVLLLMIGRVLHQAWRTAMQQRGLGKDRALIVGTGNVARMILQRIQWSPRLGYELVGLVDDDPEYEQFLGVPVLGNTAELPRIIEEFGVDEVIIALPEKGHRESVRIISLCERGQVSIKIFPDIFQYVATQPTVGDLGGLPLLSMRDYAMRGYLLAFKRLIDIIVAIIGLIFMSPLMLLVAIAIKLESPGAVFFTQVRMGLDGKPFQIIKFRSMRNDAEKNGPGWTVDDDPRQTRLGRWLRRIEMDELPQLINVLLGEMSLVGPRPEQPHYVNEFRSRIPRYMERHQTKAGMTGWAQVNGLRGDTSIEERTRYDLWYIENWSLLLDITIVFRTIRQVFSKTARKEKVPLPPTPAVDIPEIQSTELME